MENTESTRLSGKLSSDIAGLKNNLNQSYEEKEKLFKEREGLRQQIKSLVNNLRNFKKARDGLTASVRELKEKRNSLNAAIRQKISEIKSLRPPKTFVSKGPKINPRFVRKEIEAIEKKIETEVMSHEKEKQLMKILKEKRKLLGGAEETAAAGKKTGELSNEIRNLENEANDAHKGMKQKAIESQKQHEELISASKKLDELRAREKEVSKKFAECRKKLSEVNDALKGKLFEMKDASARKNFSGKPRKSKTDILKSKEAVIREKMKKGGKLTTEDILVLQGLDN